MWIRNFMKQIGYKLVSKKELLELFSLLLSLDEMKVKELIADDTAPYVVRLILKEFLGKNATKVIQYIRNYIFVTTTKEIGHSVEVRYRVTFY